MKNIRTYKYLIVTVVMVLLQSLAMAQPLPPENPEGNAVPAAGAIMLLLASATILGIKKLKKKN